MVNRDGRKPPLECRHSRWVGIRGWGKLLRFEDIDSFPPYDAKFVLFKNAFAARLNPTREGFFSEYEPDVRVWIFCGLLDGFPLNRWAKFRGTRIGTTMFENHAKTRSTWRDFDRYGLVQFLLKFKSRSGSRFKGSSRNRRWQEQQRS